MYFKKSPNDLRHPGTIVSSRSYIVRGSNGKEYRRNSRHIMQNCDQQNFSTESSQQRSVELENTEENSADHNKKQELIQRKEVHRRNNVERSSSVLQTKSGRIVKPPQRYAGKLCIGKLENRS